MHTHVMRNQLGERKVGAPIGCLDERISLASGQVIDLGEATRLRGAEATNVHAAEEGLTMEIDQELKSADQLRVEMTRRVRIPGFEPTHGENRPVERQGIKVGARSQVSEMHGGLLG